MKTNFVKFLLLVLIYAGWSGCTNKSNNSVEEIQQDNLAQLMEQFKEPPLSYAPMPLFVLNGKVTKEDLNVQLADLKDKGFGGIFFHPRPGLITEYLSDEWFDMFGYALERCKELGMEMWIYDENSYPSGFAGGHVPERMPSSHNEGLGLKGTATKRLPGDLSPYTVILKKNEHGWEDITADTGKADKTGDFYLFERTFYPTTPWNAGRTYVDLLKPGVTEKFLEVTMTEGYERFAGEFGKGIKGLFSDEPAIYAPDWESMRWTGGLFDAFKQHWGYDLRPHLPSLIEETGNWKEVRHNYYYILLQLMTEYWAKPMSEYCERNNLKWTGHYWEHEWPDPDNCPDNMAMYAYHQQPAIDLLFNNYDEDQFFPATPNNWPQPQFGCARNVKELSSAANQMGWDRSLCEMYGASGWELSFESMKRLGDWAFALGVNFQNQHLTYMTITGARKYDHPLSFSYHEPWWEHYDVMNDYFRRLSFALTRGGQINKTLVLEPTTTTWMYTQKGSMSRTMVDIGKEFHDFVNMIEKQQVEYDLASEHIIENHAGITSDKKLRVGKRVYDKIVIPPMTENINKKTADLLKDCTGTEIINMASTIGIDGKPATTTLFPKSVVSAETLAGKLYTDNWQVIEHDPAQSKLYHQRRELKDGQVLFFANTDEHKNATGIFRVKGKYMISLDPISGVYSEYPVQQVKSDFATLSVDLPPSGSLLLLVSDKKLKGSDILKISDNTYTEVKVLSELTIKPVDDNVLTLDFCDLLFNGKKYPFTHTVTASDIVFSHYGFPGNPWNSAVQFEDELVKRNNFPQGSGYETVYRFTINDQIDATAFKLVVEGGYQTVKINGHQVQHEAGQWWLDKDFKVYAIGKYVQQGANEVSVSVFPMNVFAEIEPVYILGNFGLESAQKGWAITTPKKLSAGSWRKQGLPFYARAVDYSSEYTIDKKGSYRVKLADWDGVIAEVLVNGQSAGVIFTPPFTLDVSDAIQEGNNRITVRVFGSNRNLLGPFHGRIPKGLSGPGQWMNIGEIPEGNSYQQFDYGLFDNFVLEQSNQK